MCRTVVAPSGRQLCLRHRVVALVRLARAVVDGLRRRAVLPAAAELGVEGVQRLRLEVPDRDLPEVGRDVVAHVAAVERQRVRGAVELAEVAVEQLVDGRARPRVAALGDLDPEPVADPLGLLPRLWARARRPRRSMWRLLGDRVDPGVHAHAQGAARQHLDAARSTGAC